MVSRVAVTILSFAVLPNVSYIYVTHMAKAKQERGSKAKAAGVGENPAARVSCETRRARRRGA